MKKKRFKKLSAVAIGLILILSLMAGCGSSDGSDSSGSDDEYTVAVVVKVTGIGYFNRLEEGVEKAGEELGINAYVTGPTEADSAEQVKIIEDLITQGVDALVVVPNDAEAVASVLDKARSKGITVISNESPAQEGADYDIEMVDNQKFAEATAEDFAQQIGGEGQYAQFVGGLTQPLHNTWADYVEEYFAENYPDIELVTDRIPSGEDADESRTKTLELLKTYPDLKGIISFGSQGPLGAAEASIEKNLNGKFTIIGNLMPSEALKYLEDGTIYEGVLWDPADSGYAAVTVAAALLDGTDVTASDFEIEGLGTPTLDGNTLSFDKTLRITTENAEELGF